MDRLDLIKFRGIFKVVGADIVNVAPEVIDLTLDDQPPALAAADAPADVVPAFDEESDAMAASSKGDEVFFSDSSVSAF